MMMLVPRKSEAHHFEIDELSLRNTYNEFDDEGEVKVKERDEVVSSFHSSPSFSSFPKVSIFSLLKVGTA